MLWIYANISKIISCFVRSPIATTFVGVLNRYHLHVSATEAILLFTSAQRAQFRLIFEFIFCFVIMEYIFDTFSVNAKIMCEDFVTHLLAVHSSIRDNFHPTDSHEINLCHKRNIVLYWPYSHCPFQWLIHWMKASEKPWKYAYLAETWWTT